MTRNERTILTALLDSMRRVSVTGSEYDAGGRRREIRSGAEVKRLLASKDFKTGYDEVATRVARVLVDIGIRASPPEREGGR